MQALGIDFGERRLGLSLSDPAGRMAIPIDGLERTTDRRAVYAIADLARAEEVEVLVLGLPHGPDGSTDHPAADRIRRFGAKLERATGLPVLSIDETLTTVEAAERLRGSGRRRAPRSVAERQAADRRRDAVAAQILLQEAIDRGLDALLRGRRLDQQTAEPAPLEQASAGPGPAESGPAESGPAESGPAEPGPAESGPAEARAPETRPGERSVP